MAVKIDLLPNYVKWRRWFKYLCWAAVIVLSSTGGGLWLMWYRLDRHLNKLQEDAEMLKKYAASAESAKKAKETAETDNMPMQAAIDFLTQATQTGAQKSAVVRIVKNYIYHDALVKALDISDGTKVILDVSLARPDDYYATLMDLRLGTAANNGFAFSEDATFDHGLGGFPQPLVPSVPIQAASITPGEPKSLNLPLNFKATAKLKDPISIPSDSGAPAPAAGGAPGAPGAPPTAPGPEGEKK